MNVLIVSNRRTGSFQIGKWLQKELSHPYACGIESPDTIVDYKFIVNPYSDNNEIYLKDFYKIENCIVLLYIEDYKNFIKKSGHVPEEYFDFTICLKRNNSKEHAQSLLWSNMENNSLESYTISDNWIKKYSYELQKLENQLVLEYHEMSNVIGLHVEYESLFNFENSKDIWHIVSYIGFIERFSNTINSDFKYRKYNKLNLI